MARMKALKEGGFSFSSGLGDKRQSFRVSTLGGEVYVPDEIVAKEKDLLAVMLANGDFEYVTDTTRQGPRLIIVDSAELTAASATPIPLSLAGEPVQRVVVAYQLLTAGTLLLLEETASTGYVVVDGEVFWDGADISGDGPHALFFVE